jgi:hypothetical protein
LFSTTTFIPFGRFFFGGRVVMAVDQRPNHPRLSAATVVTIRTDSKKFVVAASF